MRFKPQVCLSIPIMSRWLFIQKEYGQLGNRLHTHANALAWCIENNVNLVNLSFKKYSPFFASSKSNTVETFISGKSKLANFLHFERFWTVLEKLTRSDKWLNQLTKVAVKEKNDSEFLSETELNNSFESKTKALLVRAWDLRCVHSLDKHQTRVREILTPNDKAKDSANKKISQMFERFDCVVGVHARRGDYDKYLGGIHFHNWSSYRNWIVQTKNLIEISGKKRVGFFLCSNDTPNHPTFDDLPVYFGDSESVITDLHALSLCDYNIGPPSSFGTWLSWYGKVPRLVIQKDLQIKSISQFVIASHC